MTMPTINRTFLIDAAERVGSSFAEAVLALYLAGGVSTINASTVHVLLVAGLTAAVATVKTILAGLRTGASVSPASLLAKPAPKPRKAAKRARDAGLTLVEVLVAVLIVVVILVLLGYGIR